MVTRVEVKNKYKFYQYIKNKNEKILWEGYEDYFSFLLRNTVLSRSFFIIFLSLFIFSFAFLFLAVVGYCYYFIYRYNTRIYYILTDKYVYAIKTSDQSSCTAIPLLKGINFRCSVSVASRNTADFIFYIPNANDSANLDEELINIIKEFTMQNISNYSQVAKLLKKAICVNSICQKESIKEGISPYAAIANILYKIISKSSDADLKILDVVNRQNEIQIENGRYSLIGELISESIANDLLCNFVQDVNQSNAYINSPEDFIKKTVSEAEEKVDNAIELRDDSSLQPIKQSDDSNTQKLENVIDSNFDTDLNLKKIASLDEKRKTPSFFEKIANMFDDGKMRDEYNSKDDL